MVEIHGRYTESSSRCTSESATAIISGCSLTQHKVFEVIEVVLRTVAWLVDSEGLGPFNDPWVGSNPTVIAG